jgi:PilZ domain
MSELRRDERTLLDYPVELTREGDRVRYFGRASNISPGGMFVSTNAAFAFAFKSPVIVHMTVPGYDEPIVVPAVVRWTGRDGIGLQFSLVGARESRALALVARLQGTEWAPPSGVMVSYRPRPPRSLPARSALRRSSTR